jgi:hypothetical protein
MTSLDTSASGLFSWGRYRLPRDEVFRVRLASLTVFARKQGDEIWISHSLTPEGAPPPVEPATQEEWSRWGASESPDEIEILPTFPNRPLVLRPENPFNLLPDARARVFVRVPLWVRVSVPGARGGLLLEIPTVTLSDTWWGSPREGQLCYWLHILARREAPPSVFRSDRILCPLDLVNQAKEELPVEKTLLQVGHLSIFRGTGSLWSDEIRVRYKGESEGSDLEVTGRTPPEAPGATRLMAPRIPSPRGFSARTFSRLKVLPGFGSST